jgi:hypothetical protein
MTKQSSKAGKCKKCIFYANTEQGSWCMNVKGNEEHTERCFYLDPKYNNNQTEEFKKTDTGKPQFELLPFELLTDVNKVLQHGAVKYGINNWRKREGFKLSRCYNALLRHMFAFWRGEDNDPETGISHLAHAMCNLIFLMYHRTEKEADDRPIWKGEK